MQDTRYLEIPNYVKQHPRVLLGHGSGGRLMHGLIETLFQPLVLPGDLSVLNDATTFQVGTTRLAITTDSFVVDPIFFPGGDIGTLAVNGTVNDLAVSGARPQVLSAGFILEEGFATSDLLAVLESIREACRIAGVHIVTGDTKVVRRGQCDKIFINTSGVGAVEPGVELSAAGARAGDMVILSGDIARHGMAVMVAREKLEFARPILSDCQSLWSLVEDMLSASKQIRAMRDLTRGGLAAGICEIAEASDVGVKIYEEHLLIQDEVRGCCELLGLDPLHVANEGKLVAIVAPEAADAVLRAMQHNAAGHEARIIGQVVSERPGRVVMKTGVGGWRIVDMPAGEQLPRIC